MVRPVPYHNCPGGWSGLGTKTAQDMRGSNKDDDDDDDADDEAEVRPQRDDAVEAVENEAAMI